MSKISVLRFRSKWDSATYLAPPWFRMSFEFIKSCQLPTPSLVLLLLKLRQVKINLVTYFIFSRLSLSVTLIFHSHTHSLSLATSPLSFSHTYSTLSLAVVKFYVWVAKWIPTGERLWGRNNIASEPLFVQKRRVDDTLFVWNLAGLKLNLFFVPWRGCRSQVRVGEGDRLTSGREKKRNDLRK